jgi:hypothetical protein
LKRAAAGIVHRARAGRPSEGASSEESVLTHSRERRSTGFTNDISGLPEQAGIAQIGGMSRETVL